MTTDSKLGPAHKERSIRQDRVPTILADVGLENPLGRWVQVMREISEEMTQFTQARLREDAAIWINLLNCRSPQDALACQQRWFEKASQQYIREGGIISGIMFGRHGLNLPIASSDRPPT